MATPGHSITTKSQTLSTGFKSFFNFPALKKCRLAVLADISQLQQLTTNEMVDTFRDHELENVINTSVMPLVWENIANDLVIFICFDTCPQIPALLHEMWEHFVHLLFGLEHLSNENTWFLTMVIFDPRYTRTDCLEQLLRGVFLRYPKKEYFAVYVPPDAHPHYLFPVLKKFFKRYYPKNARTPGSPRLYVCARDKHFPRCKVRRAMFDFLPLNFDKHKKIEYIYFRPADNDDLMEMLDLRCPDLRKIYGDYVIAEMAQKIDSERNVLVIEHRNRPVGMMCLNGEPDLRLMEALQGSELMTLVHLNAFFIELTAFAEDWDEYSAYDLLLGAFELYPTKEYCVMGLPSDLRAYKYLKLFSKLAPAGNRQVPQEVYVLQKDICYSAFSVRRLEPEDFQSLTVFLEELESPNLVVEAVMECTDHDQTFILTVEKRIIGFFMVEDLLHHDYKYLAANFDLQNSYGQYGLIKLAIIRPAFSAFWGFFVRQVCAFTNFTGLFYKVSNEQNENAKLNCSFLALMRPIRPRLSNATNPADFGLCYTSKQLTICPKHDVNLKIVVAGGGRTAWSFLETLIFDSNIWLSNLTLINPYGIADGGDTPKLFPYRGSHGIGHMQRIQLPVWVNVILGKVTGVDQISKRVIIDEGLYLDYDVLYLFYGVQYEMPEKLMQPSVDRPQNFVVINTKDDTKEMLAQMQELNIVDPRSAKFVMYGLNMNSLSVLRYCLNAGICAERFTVVITPKDEFYEYDEFVQHFLEDHLKTLKIEIFHNAEIQDLIFDGKNCVNAGIFRSDKLGVSFKIECSLLIYFEKKVVTKDTRTTIINSGLGFDGRMIVDLYGRACDANIYGAGPFTKFKRMYYAERFRHELYNSEEIGNVMANELLANLKSKNNDVGLGAKAKFDAMRRQQTPFIDYCILPSNVYLLVIRPPGRRGLDLGGQNLSTSTGTPKSPQYFRVHLNTQNVIDSLICLSAQPISHVNYVKLYAKHESLLDNMLNRFNDGKITDFFEYFNQAWMSAIFHDRYCQVDHQNYQLLAHHRQPDTVSQQIFDKIEQKLISFLGKHKEELTMYATSVENQFADE